MNQAKFTYLRCWLTHCGIIKRDGYLQLHGKGTIQLSHNVHILGIDAHLEVNTSYVMQHGTSRDIAYRCA
jgi:hypothetical protein